MPDAIERLIRRALGAACLIVLAASRAAAQAPPTIPDFSLQFLSRSDFAVMMAGLADEDDRFSWDGRIGADLDLVDYGAGRFSILAEYQTVMGNQLQLFDPNQGNYTLEGSSSVRVGANEFAVMFHHVSRHLSDRAKDHAIAMNVLGGRVLRRMTFGPNIIDFRGEMGRIIQHSYIDYTWRGRADLVVRRPVNDHLGLYGRVFGDTYGVNNAVAKRGHQSGGRLEGGVRIGGKAGSVELFAGFERVVDADPLDRKPRQWTFAGFRVVN
jgi:hypothetical protein